MKEVDQAQGGNKGKKQWSKKNNKKGENNNNGGNKGKHPPCPYCKKTSCRNIAGLYLTFSVGHANSWGIWRGCVKTNSKKDTKRKQWINTRKSSFLLHLVFLVAVQVIIGL